ncbi:PfkB family carbohydrate kinase [Senegalia massiliensis]|jgi:pseudouridine kinase|uniref:PfkB family carbohydrate kinase n=1 Tax=Senegalia massiliensis TaxID=1720316 RepID=UPI001030ABD3|nr:PfkB family carbohydrate kinase [Senegalia massiliensis]
MTGREREILKLISENPLISQKELADILNIKRSSVAVHIGNLIKKGIIKGKGYILNNQEIIVIGGSNIDIQGFSNEKLIRNDSNPGKIELSVGGVARNIAENLSLLKENVNLISAIGDDIYGKKVLNELKFSNIVTDNMLISKKHSTSTYLSILDNDGDMDVAISAMDIFNEITSEFLREKAGIINMSKCIVLDTNLTKETIDYITNNYSHKDIFIDTVSTTKALKIKDIIGKFHTIKPNKYEAEILSGIKIKSKNDLEKVGNYFLNKGVKNIIITLGKEGVFYKNENASGHIKSPEIDIINATGAGDSFMAALIYGYLNDFSLEERVIFSIGASIITMKSYNTVSRDMSINNIKNIIEEMNIC